MWYENGQKRSEENYKDVDYVSGKMWDENGKEIEN